MIIGDRFQSGEVCAIAGITHRQLDYWTRRGWIGAPYQSGMGHGHPREWTLTELVKVAAMRALIDVGFTPAGASQILSGDLRRTQESQGR